MRLSNLVRHIENKSIDTSRKLGAAAAEFNHAVKTEYVRRREQRLIEQVEIMARAQMIVAKKMMAELEAEDAP